MGDAGEWNVGQLTREHYGRDAILVGFSTHHGTVTAASDWDSAAQRKRVRPGLPGSYEDLFHEVGMERFLLLLRDRDHLSARDRAHEPLFQHAAHATVRRYDSLR